MADNNTIARPYAQAVFELALEQKNMGSWSDGLEVARDVMADGQVSRFLGNPALTAAERLSFLTDLFKSADEQTSILARADKYGTNFLKLLLEYGRINVLPEIAEHFEELKAAVENMVEVTVTSAAPLGAAQQEAMESALKERLGRDVNLTAETDENLIGGAVIRAGDVVIDGSLRSRLDGLANALIA